MHRILLAAAAILLLPNVAQAQELRDLCSDRPGLGTPACTVDPGHVQVEVGLADWTRDRQPDSVIDTVLGGDTLIRIGVAETTEAQIGWTPYGHVRERDRITGAVERKSRVGDVTLALKQNLHNPNGSGFSLALLPYATLPVGRQPIGAGDWGAGLIVPLSYELSDSLQLSLTPEVDAAVDEDAHGRHLQFGSVVGVTGKLSEALSLTGELEALRDRDPSDRTTEALAGVSLAWQPQDSLQLDMGSNIGLNHDTPDIELYVGVTRRF